MTPQKASRHQPSAGGYAHSKSPDISPDLNSNFVQARMEIPVHIIISTILDKSPQPGPVYICTAVDTLRRLPDATIKLYLVYNDIQKARDPLKSRFILHDRMVEVADLLHMNLPNARLTFLNACETLSRDMERPEEVLHFMAAMFYAGFKSVVGTLWSMYEEVFECDSEMLDIDVVQYALDAAIW
jgi:hypothetical protein